MKILLIVDEIPEASSVYLLPDVSKSELRTLTKAHGHYINTNGKNEKYCLRVVGACAEQDTKNDYREGGDIDERWLAKDWAQHKQDMTNPLPIEDVDLVVRTGMIL